jgi:vancomycin permeability regulator SanA
MTKPRIARVVFVVAAVIVAVAAAIGPLATAMTVSRVYSNVNVVPDRPVAIVLGMIVSANGSPSPYLAARLDAAVALYRAGKARKLLMTGDNDRANYDDPPILKKLGIWIGDRPVRGADYNEPTVMKNYAVSRGVPAADIIEDNAGFRTYDSLYRARHVFGITHALVVTQEFHLPRSLILAHAMGIDAYGYEAPTPRGFIALARASFRERLALIEALADIATHRKPRDLGAPQHVPGLSQAW